MKPHSEIQNEEPALKRNILHQYFNNLKHILIKLFNKNIYTRILITNGFKEIHCKQSMLNFIQIGFTKDFKSAKGYDIICKMIEEALKSNVSTTYI